MNPSRRITNLWLFALLADICAVMAAYYSSYFFRFHSTLGLRFYTAVNQFFGIREDGRLDRLFELYYWDSGPRICLFLIIIFCGLYTLWDLYPERRFIRKQPVAWNLIEANTVGIVLCYLYFYARRNTFHPRSVFGTIIVLNLVYTLLFRGGMRLILRWLRRKFGIDRWKAILVGEAGDEDYVFIREVVKAVHPHGVEVAAEQGLEPDASFEEQVRKMERTIGDQALDMIICADKRLGMGQIMMLLNLGDRLDMPVKVLSSRLDVLTSQARLPADMIRGVPLVHFEAPSMGRRLLYARQVISVVAAGIALLALLPVFGLIALIIKLTSRGPVLFVQERLGVDREPFQMYKFRTMYDRADQMQAEIEQYNESGKGLFKIRNDPRITPIGRLLRRFSLDELPQLINVLKGDMVLVGPRPLPRRDFENYYEEWHYSRHGGKPGLTCLWQISGRSDIDFHNMCILDVYYLRNHNWMLDFKIALKTVWVVFFAKGAY